MTAVKTQTSPIISVSPVETRYPHEWTCCLCMLRCSEFPIYFRFQVIPPPPPWNSYYLVFSRRLLYLSAAKDRGCVFLCVWMCDLTLSLSISLFLFITWILVTRGCQTPKLLIRRVFCVCLYRRFTAVWDMFYPYFFPLYLCSLLVCFFTVIFSYCQTVGAFFIP